jgi:hypothetical protein
MMQLSLLLGVALLWLQLASSFKGRIILTHRTSTLLNALQSPYESFRKEAENLSRVAKSVSAVLLLGSAFSNPLPSIAGTNAEINHITCFLSIRMLSKSFCFFSV